MKQFVMQERAMVSACNKNKKRKKENPDHEGRRQEKRCFSVLKRFNVHLNRCGGETIDSRKGYR